MPGMGGRAGDTWRDEFGIGIAGAGAFFGSKKDLEASKMGASQGHVLRRAFDLLGLDGVLCTDSVPLVYFKEVGRIEATDAAALHRKFWNHGGAPVLVLISRDEVHVYSGLMRPGPVVSGGDIPGLVDVLKRATDAIREFLPSVESGAFFRQHERAFDPAKRVDRDLLDNLQATREKLAAHPDGKLESRVLDALLCRLVFACYLFDREIVGDAYLQAVGIEGAAHLRDVLGMHAKTVAKRGLYSLFRQLGKDFNGDLFSDNLDAEERLVHSSYIGPLDEFFRATDVVSGQQSFWPYDFSAIPIEAISAIYERFLQTENKSEGAFYTPRFLAELVLDMALQGTPSLLGRRYLDPACGSGIFLVALFNRMAEEWKQANPGARNDRRARELREILCNSLHGVDINPTACRITAFSLYLAYLDQLSPRDVLELGEKGHRLPRLVHYPENERDSSVEGHIWCGDFFDEKASYPKDVDFVVGNPPWGSLAAEDTPATTWCAAHGYILPDKKISAAFVWKAPQHVSANGKVCFVLPHGTLFNHSDTALEFQRTLLKRHAVEQILNLADYRFFLFAEARHPALVVVYGSKAPEGRHQTVRYWGPKTNWLVTRAEVISIAPEDRATLTLGEIWDDLDSKDAPQVWKQWYWGTGRDRRLVGRLSLYSRLRDHVRQTRDKSSGKRWLIAEGWQPVGTNDDLSKAKVLRLPSARFIEATSDNLNLFLLPQDCADLLKNEVKVRGRSNSNTAIFKAPHVLVSHGFTSIAYADFDLSFRHALRGIAGPTEDRALLMFMAAFLRSSIAKYFLFQTSSNWGVGRPKVHVEELLRLPFPLPEELPNPKRAEAIVKKVAELVAEAATQATAVLVNHQDVVRRATISIEPLIYEYFDTSPLEEIVIEDALRVTIPSVQPKERQSVPTMEPSAESQRTEYTARLCDTLNGWSQGRRYAVRGQAAAALKLGIGIAVLQKIPADAPASVGQQDLSDVLSALSVIQKASAQRMNTFELIRGAKVFDRDRLYVVKPIEQRFWTQTAALNDADEIAGSILMHARESAAW